MTATAERRSSCTITIYDRVYEFRTYRSPDGTVWQRDPFRVVLTPFGVRYARSTGREGKTRAGATDRQVTVSGIGIEGQTFSSGWLPASTQPERVPTSSVGRVGPLMYEYEYFYRAVNYGSCYLSY